MKAVLKYYPKNSIYVEDILDSLKNKKEIKINSSEDKWIDGKINFKDYNITFLITEKGSFLFSVHQIKKEIFDYLEDIMRDLRFKSFRLAMIKPVIENNSFEDEVLGLKSIFDEKDFEYHIKIEISNK
jgi:hypothetical protein